jgi:surface-anchored protein
MKTNAVILGLTLLATSAYSQIFYTEGHADIGIGHDGTNWDLHFHDETGGIEYEPEDVIVVVSQSSLWTSPNSNFNFTGATTGQGVYRLRQTPFSGQPFIGMGTEEFDAPSQSYTDSDARLTRAYGNQTDEWVSLELLSVSGPGEFSAWGNDPDGSGTPLVWMSTFDGGITGLDRYVTRPGVHDHVNLGFSKAGTYEVTFQARFWNGSNFDISAPATYNFTAVPEPGSMAALGLGIAAILRKRKQK